MLTHLESKELGVQILRILKNMDRLQPCIWIALQFPQYLICCCPLSIIKGEVRLMSPQGKKEMVLDTKQNIAMTSTDNRYMIFPCIFLYVHLNKSSSYPLHNNKISNA